MQIKADREEITNAEDDISKLQKLTEESAGNERK